MRLKLINNLIRLHKHFNCQVRVGLGLELQLENESSLEVLRFEMANEFSFYLGGFVCGL